MYRSARILCAISFVVLLLCAPNVFALSANFGISDSYITVGESFDVSISVTGDENFGQLTGFGFDFFTDADFSYFSYDGLVDNPNWDYFYMPGDWLKPDHLDGLFWLGGDNIGQEVLLATLSFTALSAGMDTLSIEGFFDGKFSGLFYEKADQSIIGSLDIAVVPEPSTLLLLGIGLLGLSGARRRYTK